MKRKLLNLLLVLIILQSSCTKDEPYYVNDYEIMVIKDGRTNLYKYNSQSNLMSRNTEVEGRIWYYYESNVICKYDQKQLPIEIVSTPLDGSDVNRFNFQYNETDNSLRCIDNSGAAPQTYIYFLNNDFTVNHILSENNDTFATYHYSSNGNLETIKHYNREVSLFYDINNNLIKVKTLYQGGNEYIDNYHYDSKNRLITITFNGANDLNYTYHNDGRLALVNGNNIFQKRIFTPKSMIPSNFYKYEYLKLRYYGIR
ncbi:hypothetical protein ACFLQ5_00810 [Bacteroidota bacterium]